MGLHHVFDSLNVLGAGLWLPDNHSTYGGAVDQIFWIIFAITTVAFIATESLLVYYLVKYRAREGGKATHIHTNHKLEIVWTVATGAILFVLAVYQWNTWDEIKISLPSGEKNAEVDGKRVYNVRVIARQFEWLFLHQGPDHEWGTGDDFLTSKELWVPVDRPVRLEMRSTDVIHSLFLPHMRFKQDVMPGITVTAWFEATATTWDVGVENGTNTDEDQAKRKAAKSFRDEFLENYYFDIACAELCGMNHYAMRAKCFVLSKDEFNDWEARYLVERLRWDHVERGGPHSLTEKFRGFWQAANKSERTIEPPADMHGGHGDEVSHR